LSADVGDPAGVEAAFSTLGGGWMSCSTTPASPPKPPPSTKSRSRTGWPCARTNITGMFLCARAAFGLMRRQSPQGGRIINNGSISAHARAPGSAPYTMSKHAVTGLTRTLAWMAAPSTSPAAQIDIGNALTEMAQGFTKGVPQADGRDPGRAGDGCGPCRAMVLHMASLPLDVNTPFVTLMARDMPFIGRG
jgi:NADP-dependent 3-hydroxy acid dehydrogenase YdfG